ncbi:MAG TPA: urease accessory UreF family protein [Opitutaceae bacterium]
MGTDTITTTEPAFRGPASEMTYSIAHWLPALLQLSDTFYPTGAYAHSFGLEGLVQDGRIARPEDLRPFLLESVLPLLAQTDLPLAASAWSASGEPPNWRRLEELCFLASATRGAREPRTASNAIGSQRLSMAARLRGGVAAAFLERSTAGHWPCPSAIVAAIEARSIGAPAEAALAGIIYSTVAALLAAAVKLLRLGQNAVQSLLTECLSQAPKLIAASVSPRDDTAIGAFAPWWDVAAARHEAADFRLFIS